MSLQSQVGFRYSTGMVGEPQADVPKVVRAWRLSDQATVPNTVGKAFTYSADAEPSGGNQSSMIATVGGTGKFAGILVNPKHYVLNGKAGDPLAPSLDVAPNSEVELMTMGNVIVSFGAAVAYGDPVYFINSTGALGAGTAEVGQTQIEGAKVLTTTSGAGLAVISLG